MNQRDLELQPSEPAYRTIALTKGQFTIVDESDYEWLNQWKWQASWVSDTKSFYATRAIKSGQIQKTFLMHREIAFPPVGSCVDHANRNTLDNRRSNLRICSYSQNMANSKMSSRNTSGEKGVSFDRKNLNWKAYVTFKGKTVWLGRFPSKEAASTARQLAAKSLHGEFYRGG